MRQIIDLPGIRVTVETPDQPQQQMPYGVVYPQQMQPQRQPYPGHQTMDMHTQRADQEIQRMGVRIGELTAENRKLAGENHRLTEMMHLATRSNEAVQKHLSEAQEQISRFKDRLIFASVRTIPTSDDAWIDLKSRMSKLVVAQREGAGKLLVPPNSKYECPTESLIIVCDQDDWVLCPGIGHMADDPNNPDVYWIGDRY